MLAELVALAMQPEFAIGRRRFSRAAIRVEEFHGGAARARAPWAFLSFETPNQPDEVTVKIDLRYAIACAVVAALSASTAIAAQDGVKATVAAERTPAQESQQNRMKRCNAEAKEKELKGDSRRAFMSSCLKS